MLSAERVKEAMYKAGFDQVGIVAAHPFPQEERRFRQWVSAGRHASLGYLERNIEKRFNPSLLVEGSQTIVVGAVSYKNRHSLGYPPHFAPKIASYALNQDYHTTLKTMLHEAFVALKGDYPSLTGRAFTDSAPLAEKRLAVEAGIGWVGRQSLIISPTLGSFFHLGELLLSASCDHYDTPFGESRCGSCRACIEACPVGAIGEDRMIDARRCIACRTIERGEGSDEDLHGWIFGCDGCQSCCPHNRQTPLATHPSFQPIIDPLKFDTERWQQMTPEEFSERFDSTPLTRAGLERLKKNAFQINHEHEE